MASGKNVSENEPASSHSQTNKERTTVKTYSAKARVAVVLAVLAIPLALGGLRVYAGWYTAESAPVMDTTLYHEVYCSVLPTDRTTIGIGELAHVYFNPACTDIDRYHYTYDDWDTVSCTWVVRETSFTFQDYLGRRIWEYSAVFNNMSGIATGETWSGSGVYVVAALASSDQTGTVSWLLHCSESAFDEIINLGSVSFAVKVPSGVNARSHNDNYIAVPKPTGDYMKHDASYCLQVLPNTVCFDAVTVSEYLPDTVYTWPNGTTFKHGFTASAGLACGDDPYDASTSQLPNLLLDHCVFGFSPTSRLIKAGSSPPTRQDVSFPFHQYMRFQDLNGNWITFFDHDQTRSWRGSDCKTHSQWDAQVESWRGPFS
jgi:hypothetical protein